MNIIQLLTLTVVMTTVATLCLGAIPSRPQCGTSFSFLASKNNRFGLKVINSARWMNNLAAQLSTKKYSQVVIPATHDSVLILNRIQA